jgi:hypothetical protein
LFFMSPLSVLSFTSSPTFLPPILFQELRILKHEKN